MQDDELRQQIVLGLAPWIVGEIKAVSDSQQLHVQVECGDDVPKRCPHCDSELPVRDHGSEQIWRQPDAGPWRVVLRGRLPLLECPEHGLVRVPPPWADWYFRSPGRAPLGPWSLQQIRFLLEVGRISPSTLLKRSSTGKWVITATVATLFARQDVSPEPALSADELAAVDWAITYGPPKKPGASESFALANEASEKDTTLQLLSKIPETDGDSTSQQQRQRSQPALQPRVNEKAPISKGSDARSPKRQSRVKKPSAPPKELIRKLLSDIEPSHEPEPRRPKVRKAAPAESSPSGWATAIKKVAKMARKEKAVRKKTRRKSSPSRIRKESKPRELVRNPGFQNGFQLLTTVYLINACLVSCMVAAVCTIFFSRLLAQSTSVFAPFEGGDVLQEGQLVACGLSALSLLVLVGFPVWHLMSNDGVLWHFIPSGLLGMAIGFWLSPEYLGHICAVLQWSGFALGSVTVVMTAQMLFALAARSQVSLPIAVASLLTAISTAALFFVRASSMLTVDANSIPPQFRGAVPDAPLYVVGLIGTLVCIPASILFELYQQADSISREFFVRTGILLGAYLLASLATLGTFVSGADSGFFDVPLALTPLACINALAAAIPSTLLMVDPQYSSSRD